MVNIFDKIPGDAHWTPPCTTQTQPGEYISAFNRYSVPIALPQTSVYVHINYAKIEPDRENLRLGDE